MADAAQLEVLRKGVRAWNAWRKAHPSVKPDLSQAQLAETMLRWKGLTFAQLR